MTLACVRYARACRAFGATAPRLGLEPLSPSRARKGGPSKGLGCSPTQNGAHPLVVSDYGASRQLGELARDPDSQMRQFLDREVSTSGEEPKPTHQDILVRNERGSHAMTCRSFP